MANSGSPLEETGLRTAARSDARSASAALVAVLVPVGLGVLAGASRVFLKTSLQMPGHSVIWWYAPILAAKLVAGRRYSATIAGLAAAGFVAAFARGGSLFVGPVAFTAAGAVTDVLGGALHILTRSRVALVVSAVILGMAANLARLCVRTVAHGPKWRFSLDALAGRALSYIAFGALTGAIVAGALILAGLRKKRGK